MIGRVAGAELNALEADAYALGPESNERTSAAVVLTLFRRLGRYLVDERLVSTRVVNRDQLTWSNFSFTNGTSPNFESATLVLQVSGRVAIVDNPGKRSATFYIKVQASRSIEKASRKYDTVGEERWEAMRRYYMLVPRRHI